jgi:predicted Fe-S protein YdhL (DUF1289 family)
MGLKGDLKRLEKEERAASEKEKWRPCTPEEEREMFESLRRIGERNGDKYPPPGYPCLLNYHLLTPEQQQEVWREQERHYGKRRE